MEYGILGPLEVRDGEHLVEIRSAKQRALLAILLLHANEVVASERLIAELWDDGEDGAAHRLQVHVSQLRKALGPDVLETHPPGYVLRLGGDELDLRRFEALVTEGRRAREEGDPERAAASLRAALELWRGPALADFAYDEFAQREATRLEELRLAALEDRIDADLAAGRGAELVGELEALVAEHPLRERLHGELMLALYRSGRQAEALQAYQSARRVLVDELGIEPGRALQELERSILVQDAALDGPARGSYRPEVKLPSPPTPLLGREQDVEEAALLARRADVRLLTFTGPGGIGKTRLALEVAREVSADFRDGTFFVDLAPIADPSLLAPAVLKALEIPQREAPPDEVLEQELRERSLLLLLDSFEHVMDAAPLVSGLLRSAPRLALLVTSRATLRVDGEHEFAVGPLELPRTGTGTAERLLQSPAVALFAERAEAAARDFALTDENASAVAAICARLDGLPLAIELAAARAKLLPPAAMLERLGARLELLKGGPRDAPARQQTLRTTIDWSYDLLDEDEQRLLARLAVFAGGCTLEAAEAVCAEGGLDVLEGLASLVNKSLIRRLRRAEARFAMLDTLREYASERLSTAGEEEPVRRRHAEYFTALAETADPELIGPRQSSWLERLETEHDNLRAALAFSLERGEAALALRIAVGLAGFWKVHGHLQEGRRGLEAALALSEQEAVGLRARALNGAGILAGELGDIVAARRLFEESLALTQQIGDRDRTATALANLGTLALFGREFARARDLYDRAAELWRETRNLRGLSVAVENLGLVAFCEDDLEQAVPLLEEAVALARRSGDVHQIAAALRSVGRALLVRGEVERAADVLEESLALARELGERHAIAESLEAAAAVAAADAAPERAAVLFGAGDALRDGIGAPRMPDQLAWYARTLEAVRALLVDSAFSEAYEQGRGLPLEQAIELALERPVARGPLA